MCTSLNELFIINVAKALDLFGKIYLLAFLDFLLASKHLYW